MSAVLIDVQEANTPLVLGLPHTGTELPDEIAASLNETGLALADTDWHVHQLYDGLVEATTIRTPMHRYAIDVNRDPNGASLYPGQNTTGLCPLTDFDGKPIYRVGAEPDATEIERRRLSYHAPYHEALSRQLDRVKAQHGFAILYDCHSIRGDIPFLFEGRLPDLNVGTNGGTTCAPGIEAAAVQACDAADYTNVLNGRFKGGWTTRHYGRPAEGLHAIQMELAQATYMQETPPWTYNKERADTLRILLRNLLTDLIHWTPA